MNDLYDIFKRERERVGNTFTLLYNKARNSLQYSDKDGKLTVMFNGEERSEKFYFSNDTHAIGELVYATADAGQIGKFSKSFRALPQKYIDLVQAYQFDRSAIGVEGEKEKAVIKSEMAKRNKRQEEHDI